MGLTKIIHSATEKITEFDIFGQTINFTYKGKDEFQTLFGGLVSICIKIIMVLYLYLQLNILIYKKDTSTSTNSLVRNLRVDSEALQIVDSDFSLGVAIQSNYFDVMSDETYISLQFFQIVYDDSGISSQQPISKALCGNDYFRYEDQDLVDSFGISYYICPVTNEFEVQGNIFADTYKYFGFTIKKCSGTTASGAACASEADIEEALQYIDLRVALVNSYFDFEDYNQPVQTYIDDRYVFSIVYGYDKFINMFISQDEGDYNDHIISYQPEGTGVNFVSVNKYTEEFRTMQDDNILMSVNFVKDYDYRSYSRQVFGLFDMFGNLGGLFEILEISGGIIVGIFASRLFSYSIVSTFYQIDSSIDHKPNDADKFNDENMKLEAINDSVDNGISNNYEGRQEIRVTQPKENNFVKIQPQDEVPVSLKHI